eukprot:CAMPEP_0177651992 /NCGR_PEP_ID=MMETSP0447-20121125/12862_1 /TAXON_ID=0 /ORGANISM="Stygamoeba regulata, Strain BSH-02190019" /LENGTH=153 /DNA_ID=CAMNT_0019155147 /DNA_START=138 /DNA_END=599 /DNA_ORIENTATION=-
MEILSLVWDEPAGACWDILNCEPCCGEPCNPGAGLYCFACWFCCGLCSGSKLFAFSVDQDCACVNHVLPLCFCGICTQVVMRHNLRVRFGAGPAPEDVGGWIGDALLSICCGPCSGCQELRSVKIEDWNWLSEIQEKGFTFMVDPFKCIRESK